MSIRQLVIILGPEERSGMNIAFGDTEILKIIQGESIQREEKGAKKSPEEQHI